MSGGAIFKHHNAFQWIQSDAATDASSAASASAAAAAADAVR